MQCVSLCCNWKQKRYACLSKGGCNTQKLTERVKYWHVGSSPPPLHKQWGYVDKAEKAVARDRRRSLISMLPTEDAVTPARVSYLVKLSIRRK